MDKKSIMKLLSTKNKYLTKKEFSSFQEVFHERRGTTPKRIFVEITI